MMKINKVKAQTAVIVVLLVVIGILSIIIMNTIGSLRLEETAVKNTGSDYIRLNAEYEAMTQRASFAILLLGQEYSKHPEDMPNVLTMQDALAGDDKDARRLYDETIEQIWMVVNEYGVEVD
jgi:hypothetical protein